MGIRVGIDIGTTYSKIAFVDNDGRPTVISNFEGEYATPSAVLFNSPNDVVIGLVAKENAVLAPERTISDIKSLIGAVDFSVNFDNHNWTFEEVMSLLIKKLVNDAEIVMGTYIDGAVITVPAYFGIAECTAMKNAGEIAGLNVIGIISEPTAAALYYGCAKEQGEKTILVYDLGGGTFDVTVMRISAGKIEAICSDGNHELGGKNWDDAVIQYLTGEFCSETGFDGDFDEYAQQDFRLKAERAKKQLSSREEVPVLLDAAGLRARISISRTTFDEITQTLLNESIEKTDAAIAVAESKGYKIDEILLVGGSTRMPQVTKALVEKYGIEPRILEPDEAVAKGAAIYATLYTDNHSFTNRSLSDEYTIKITIKGKNISQSVLVKDWKLSECVLSATRKIGIVDYYGGPIDFEIYEYNDVKACNADIIHTNKYNKLSSFTIDYLDNAIPMIIQIELSLNLNSNLDICCRNVNNRKEATTFKFTAHSRIIQDEFYL